MNTEELEKTGTNFSLEALMDARKNTRAAMAQIAHAIEPGMLEEDARSIPIGLLRPQLTAFFTSAPILASSAAVNSFSAKAVGHMAPSSRFASCMKPNVAYLVLNFCALW